MRVIVVGLGYVGCVSAGALAHLGHLVKGIDINKSKIDAINQGRATVVEPELDSFIRSGVDKGLISASDNLVHELASFKPDLIIICIGTPNKSDGSLDTSSIFSLAPILAHYINSVDNHVTISIRSTINPCTTRLLESSIVSSLNDDSNFGVVANPEFLREGVALKDFFNPPYTVVGCESLKSLKCMQLLYHDLDAPFIHTSIEIAESIKFINNSWHALKVAFGNEIGRIASVLDVNSVELMDLFCQDKHLNISSKYLTPGMTYGGSCLPKDLKALNSIAITHALETPLLASVALSNTVHLSFIKDKIEELTCHNKKIAIYGLAFKSNTDDLRYSPSVEIVEYFLGKGHDICIYDENVIVSNLLGANAQHLISRIPHIQGLLQENITSFINHSDLIVLINRCDYNTIAQLKSSALEKTILDFADNKDLYHMNGYLSGI
jgi:GDP-mannose 6-dehydrogenase